jgi:hypothetical protein
MATAYYSTIFQEPAADIWEIVRDFNNYPIWVDGCGDSLIEGGKSGEAVGAIRSVLYQGRHIRQRLLALSDTDRSQTYEFCDVALPVNGFRATLRISEVVDGNRAFVEWWANFDCGPGRRDELTGTLRSWFAKASNRCGWHLPGPGASPPQARPGGPQSMVRDRFGDFGPDFRQIFSGSGPACGCCIHTAHLA